jgi:acyl-CoA dehydrogenase
VSVPGFLEAHHEALAREARERLRPMEARPEDEGDDAGLARRVAALGYYRHLVPAEYGGTSESIDVRAVCVLREELAYRNAAADSVFAVQGLGSHPVLLGGPEAQRRELLPGVANGSVLFAFALTEPGAGSDAAALTTRARSEGDSYVLDGEKRFVSNAGVATHYTVFARTSAEAKGISAFVVSADAPGFRVRQRMQLLGDHPIGEIELSGCRIPASARLGDEGQGMRLALATLDVFRATVGAAAVGMARRALDEAVAYSGIRHQFGAPLSALQGVQFLLAESAAELEASRLLVHRAAAARDGGAPRVTYESAVAKLFATEAAQRIVDRAVQIHGGNGVVKGHPMERLYRDVRALRIYEGASEVQKVLIARHLLQRR